MKRVKRQQRAAEAGNGKEPKWWKKDIMAPIIVGIILSIVGFGIWLMQKSSEEKYGDLVIASNVDRATVFLNQDSIGLTQSSRAVTFTSLKPGVYVLSAAKEGFISFVNPNIKIAAGEITSIQADLKMAGANEIRAKDTLKLSPSFRRRAEAGKDGWLLITVTDRFENAKIKIDGQWVATAPNTIRVSAGRRHLRVEKDGFCYDDMIEVSGQDTIPVNIEDDEFEIIRK